MLLPLLIESRNKSTISCWDEVAFHLNGLINKHNVRYWCEEHSWITIETVMQSLKVHVCCSMSESRVIGPYLFDDDTINRQNSYSMLKEFFVPELKRLRKASSAIFQQDGTPAHFSLDVRQYLDNVFPNQWMGRADPIICSPGLFSMGIC